MVRMKLNRKEFNVKELDQPYDPEEARQFKRYEGDIPRTGTSLIARVTKAWWTQSSDGTSAMKLLLVAEQNEGDKAKFNDLPTWEMLTFKSTAAFRYNPFLYVFGITLDDIFSDMDVEEDDDKVGTPINSIGDWVVGSDDALCRFIVMRDHDNQGDLRSNVDRDGWLPLEDDEGEEEPEEEPEPERPTRARRGATARRSSDGASQRTRGAASRRRGEPDEDEDEADEYVEDEDEQEVEDSEEEPEDGDEEEEEPARPTRRGTGGRGRTTRREPARASTRGSDGRRAASSRDGASRSSSRSTAGAGPARRGRTTGKTGRDGGSTDDPPF